ncbi:MAG: C25 family cysteine peptidase [Actinomycetota bacterium]|nr:C25 family cysteine peptidase [Actinomycetota bacterium]
MMCTRPTSRGRILVLLLAFTMVAGTGVGSAQEPPVALTVTKTASPAVIHAGDEVTYEITVDNTGSWPLSLDIEDDVLGTVAADGPIDNGASQTFTVTSTVFEDVTNTVTVTGHAIGSDVILPPAVGTASATVDVLNPAIAVTKIASTERAVPGEVVEYTVEVTNTGDTPLTVDIADTVFGSLGADLPFEPGQVAVFGTEHHVDEDVTNTVTVTGTDAIDGVVTASATATVTVGEDTDPPRFVEGPSVSETTPGSAVIEWVTDEPADGLVRFDSRAGVLTLEVADATLVTRHAVTLDGLAPASTYHFVASTSDAAGNTASSRDIIFATPAEPDARPPEVSLISPLRWEGRALVEVDAVDASGIDRVEFLIDDVFVFADYSPPFQFNLDSHGYANGPHQVTSRAFDLAGNTLDDSATIDVANLTDGSTPVVDITWPADGDQVSGKIQVKVSLSDDVGLFKGTLLVDGKWAGNWYPDPAKAATSMNIEYPWDTRLRDNGPHRVAFEIYDTDLKYAVDFVDIVVNNSPPPPPPKLVVSRSVVRHGNYFTVDLTVKNVGGDTATNVRLQDTLQLFQPISRSTADVDYSASYKPELTSWRLDITDNKSLGAGAQRTYRYDAVPVLVHPGSPTPMIGGDRYSPSNGSTITWFEDAAGQNYYIEHHLMYSPSQAGSSYGDALGVADYLIVTSPANLFRLNPASDTNELLSSMADLARLKNGVLGYLDVPASFPRDFEAHDGFTIGDVREDGKAEVIIGDASNGRVVVANIPTTALRVAGTISYESKWFENTGFKIGYLEQGFDAGDRLATGNVFGGAKDHVLMSDASANFIFAHDGSGFTQGTFYIDAGGNSPLDIEPYDGLTAGNVATGTRDEMVFADRSANKIYVMRFTNAYPADPPNLSRSLTKITSFATDYEIHDGLATGDVTGSALDEIVLADRSGNKVFIFSGSGSVVGSFNRNFEEGDGLAVANVVSTYPDKAEIIISDHSANRVYAYTANGTLLASVERDLQSFDGLAAGPITGGPIGDVVVADQSLDYLDFHSLGRPSADKFVLQDLIEGEFSYNVFTGPFGPTATGSWSTRLFDDWMTDGYLLIVGESDIVPTWGNRIFGSVLTTKGTKLLFAQVTDYPYASTYGQEITPELAIGRIIGNTAAELRKPIEASIGVATGAAGTGYDRSHALVVSGYDAGLGGGSDSINFQNEAMNAALTLKNSGVDPIVMHTPTYTQYKPDGSIDEGATRAKIVAKFFAHTPGKDVIFLSGHGGGTGWDQIGWMDVLARTDPFGSTNPFVFASSCNTGQFFHAYSIANAFLSRGTAAYLGATTWGLGSHAWISNRLFSYWDPGETIGEVVKEVKRSIGFMTVPASMFGDGAETVVPRHKEQYWSAIYHVFGDPKYGGEGPPAPAPASSTSASTGSTSDQVGVEVPGYDVTEHEGEHTVVVPGGGRVSISGYPSLPYYTTLIEIPAGYEVQGVAMTGRSEPIPDTGLNIPPVMEAVGASDEDTGIVSSEESESGWWPQVPFSWTVIDGPDGDTLAITVFPVDYNSETTDLRFYQSYVFDVETAPSPIEIRALMIDERVFGIDSMTGEVSFGDGRRGEVPPEGRDVVVHTVVKAESTGDLVAGLPLRTLAAVKGDGAYAVAWDPGDAVPGVYTVEVELRGTDGMLIDRRTTTVHVEGPPPAVRSCSGLAPTIVGSEGDDVLRGTDGDDVIVGLGGNDTIAGLGGNDVICGGDGDDSIDGGEGDDALYGQEGDDELSPGFGNDAMSGGPGVDLARLDGDRAGVTADLAIGIAHSPGGIYATLAGFENVTGGSGPDELRGDNGPNILNGAAGNDTISGLGGDDKLIGSNGDDELYGGDGDDVALAGVGDDTIEGGRGDDKLQGMNGKDLIFGRSGDDVLDGGPGNDELDGGEGYDTLDGRSGRDFCDGEVERNCELGPG